MFRFDQDLSGSSKDKIKQQEDSDNAELDEKFEPHRPSQVENRHIGTRDNELEIRRIKPTE